MTKTEWIEWRRTKIGASDAPIILGISPWRTPRQLWEEKIFGIEQRSNPAIERGNELEPIARAAFEEQMNCIVRPKVMTATDYEWMIASLDGIDFDEKIVVEIKCGGKKTHEAALEGRVPEIYYPQLQHQMYVVSVEHMYFYSYDGQEGVIVEVERDDSFVEMMIKEEKRFLEMMRNLEPPPLTDKEQKKVERKKSKELILN